MLPTPYPNLENVSKALLGAFLIPFVAWHDLAYRVWDKSEDANLTAKLLDNIKSNLSKENLWKKV